MCIIWKSLDLNTTRFSKGAFLVYCYVKNLPNVLAQPTNKLSVYVDDINLKTSRKSITDIETCFKSKLTKTKELLIQHTVHSSQFSMKIPVLHEVHNSVLKIGETIKTL